MSRRVLPSLALLALLSGCAAQRLPPVTAPGFAMDRDERLLWKEAEELAEESERSGALDQDPALARYVNEVAARLLPEKARGPLEVRVRVLAAPYLNAFALPNGAIFLTTGMLARMENEAQLAAVLGHELVHALNRHSVVEYRTFKNGVVATAVIPGAGILGLGALGTKAAVTGYSRDFEREADAQGFAMMQRAGYAPQEAVRVFEHMKQWLDDEGEEEPFFFGSHPRLAERIASARAWVARQPAAGQARELGRERYEAVVREALLRAARMDLIAGRFKAAVEGARRYVAQQPRSAIGWAVLGDAARQAGQKGGEAEALEHFRKAVALDAGCAEAQRGLGQLLAKRGDKAQAAAALRRYLKLRPQAEDRGWVEADLRSLEGVSR